MIELKSLFSFGLLGKCVHTEFLFLQIIKDEVAMWALSLEKKKKKLCQVKLLKNIV